jgi:hypothetical protein
VRPSRHRGESYSLYHCGGNVNDPYLHSRWPPAPPRRRRRRRPGWARGIYIYIAASVSTRGNACAVSHWRDAHRTVRERAVVRAKLRGAGARGASSDERRGGGCPADPLHVGLAQGAAGSTCCGAGASGTRAVCVRSRSTRGARTMPPRDGTHRAWGRSALSAALLAAGAATVRGGDSPTRCLEGSAYKAFATRSSFDSAQDACAQW